MKVHAEAKVPQLLIDMIKKLILSNLYVRLISQINDFPIGIEYTIAFFISLCLHRYTQQFPGSAHSNIGKFTAIII